MNKVSMLVLVVVAMMAGVSRADEVTMYPVTLLNPSFETPEVTGHTQVATVPGWVKGTAVAPGIGETTDWYTGVEPGGTDGAQCLYASAFGANLIQHISGIAQPGETYTLQVDARGNHPGDVLGIVMVVENTSELYSTEVVLTVGEWVTGTLTCTLPEGITPNAGFVIGVGGNHPVDGWQGDILVDNVQLFASYEVPEDPENLSFEFPAVTEFTELKSNGVVSLNLPGWDMSGLTYAAVLPGGTDGAQNLYLNGPGADLVTSFPAMGYPNTTYVLQVDAKGNEATDKMDMVMIVDGAMETAAVDLILDEWTTGRLYMTTSETVPAGAGITIGIGGENTDIEIDNVRMDAVKQNMSFEFPVVEGWTQVQPSELPGWESSTYTYAAVLPGGTDGNQSLYLNSNGANLIQRIMLDGQPGKNYKLQVDAKGNEDGDNLVLVIVIENSSDMGTLEVPVSTTEWTTGELVWTAPELTAPDSNLWLGIGGYNTTAEQCPDIEIDNVRLTSWYLMAGDANGDGLVDVGDLGILAANYGGTDKAWAEGDFNGDGLVDVGDLGILAANYGAGTSGANWDVDYAKVFGTGESDDEEISSTICSGLGLPLVAGLLLAGLMLVKLEE